jgi:hypothetical protein
MTNTTTAPRTPKAHRSACYDRACRATAVSRAMHGMARRAHLRRREAHRHG